MQGRAKGEPSNCHDQQPPDQGKVCPPPGVRDREHAPALPHATRYTAVPQYFVLVSQDVSEPSGVELAMQRTVSWQVPKLVLYCCFSACSEINFVAAYGAKCPAGP